jgi:glycosyltransferase involved in cell wall biosynthesis
MPPSRNFQIVHIVPSLSAGGMEVLVSKLARRQTSTGHNVSVVSLMGSKQGMDSSSFHQLTKLELVKSGVEVIELNCRPRNALAIRFKLGSFLRKLNNVFIIHCHTPSTLASLLFLNSSYNVLYTAHQSKVNFSNKLYKILLSWVGNITAVSTDVKEYLNSLTKSPVRCIHNGVDLDEYKLKDWSQKTSLSIRLISVARFDSVKRVDRTIEAFALLCRHGFSEEINFHLTLLGQGPLEDSLKHLASELGVENMICFAGVKQDVSEELRSADIFILGSDREGMPISLIEAMATGLPVVTTPFESSNELVSNEFGRRSSNFSSHSLFESVLNILNKKNDFPLMGIASRTAAMRYSLEFTELAYQREYARILNEDLTLQSES